MPHKHGFDTIIFFFIKTLSIFKYINIHSTCDNLPQCDICLHYIVDIRKMKNTVPYKRLHKSSVVWSCLILELLSNTFGIDLGMGLIWNPYKSCTHVPSGYKQRHDGIVEDVWLRLICVQTVEHALRGRTEYIIVHCWIKNTFEHATTCRTEQIQKIIQMCLSQIIEFYFSTHSMLHIINTCAFAEVHSQLENIELYSLITFLKSANRIQFLQHVWILIHKTKEDRRKKQRSIGFRWSVLYLKPVLF